MRLSKREPRANALVCVASLTAIVATTILFSTHAITLSRPDTPSSSVLEPPSRWLTVSHNLLGGQPQVHTAPVHLRLAAAPARASTQVPPHAAPPAAGLSNSSSAHSLPQHNRQQHQQQQSSPAPSEDDHSLTDPPLPPAPASLDAWLNLSSHTALNYFHNHKTGGTTFAGRIRQILSLPSNQARSTVNGHPLCFHRTCATMPDGSVNCDLDTLRDRPPSEIAQCDVMVGHQYFANGTDMLYAGLREVRHVTTLRHPFARRLSAFHHFHVRDGHRPTDSVSLDEVVSFLFRAPNRTSVFSRLTGVHYYTSYMLSDGHSLFDYHQFIAPVEGTPARKAMLAKAVTTLQTRFVLVGLQSQPRASFCMLERLLQRFAAAHGVIPLDGLELLRQHGVRWNTGDYRWSTRKVWAALNSSQRAEYRRRDAMDWTIYDKARDQFADQVKRYGCEHLVDKQAWENDTFG